MNDLHLKLVHLSDFGTLTFNRDGILAEGTYDFLAELPAYEIFGKLVLVGYIQHGIPKDFDSVQITQLPGNYHYLIEYGTTDL